MTKLSLEQQFIDELKKENLEVEQFNRFLKRKETLLKKGEVLDLKTVKAEFVALQNEITKKVKMATETEKPVSKAVFAANQKAAENREAAAKARAKAQSYTGTLPEEAQDAINKILHIELSQNTYDMQPAQYAQTTIDGFIKQLKILAMDSKAAIEVVRRLADKFASEAIKLEAKQIDNLTYIKNCKAVFEEHKSELVRPYTFSEQVYHSVINAVRLILNLFDNIYTWLISAELTQAETKDYKPTVVEPITQLGQKVSVIQNEFVSLEKDVKQTEAKIAAHAEKLAQREIRKKQGEQPYLAQIAAARAAAAAARAVTANEKAANAYLRQAQKTAQTFEAEKKAETLFNTRVDARINRHAKITTTKMQQQNAINILGIFAVAAAAMQARETDSPVSDQVEELSIS